ncbi:MAG: SDR family oxidoreductase [Bacteroidetes bacterium]|nr:SDR family oxidoreductase [Bacteroidota bacterium]
MQKKRILITGSNGLLGQKLTDLYRSLENADVLLTGIGENRYPDNSVFSYTQMDITNHDETAKILRQFSPDTIINTAAMTNVDACETARELCMEINVHAVENLAKLASEMHSHFIHLSTDFIFPGTKAMYKEEDIAEPLSYYGKSKWEGEKKVMEFAEKWSILRTAIVFGVANNLSRGNTIQWAYDTLKAGKAANVVDDQFRTPTLAEDLAMGCRLVESKEVAGIFNICGMDFMSILEMVERIGKYFDFPLDKISIVSSESLNQPAKRPPITGLDISKARKILGYEPHSFEESLAIFASQLN